MPAVSEALRVPAEEPIFRSWVPFSETLTLVEASNAPARAWMVTG